MEDLRNISNIIDDNLRKVVSKEVRFIETTAQKAWANLLINSTKFVLLCFGMFCGLLMFLGGIALWLADLLQIPLWNTAMALGLLCAAGFFLAVKSQVGSSSEDDSKEKTIH